MKVSRHEKIKEIIEAQVIETQDDLAKALRNSGIDVTQATVSRDIKELMLIKIPNAFGGYRYAFPKEQGMYLSQGRLERTFQDSIVSLAVSENLLVVRTLPGTAQAVAYGIDYLKWPEVLGTVAGDDTIFICVDKRENMKLVSEKLNVHI
ncbi:MAG TPA: arginine repressor [Candidatus Avacidaminococcus intestinavium]|uniref:Arginine repressor n=1 Tax=Candidatus Avacidaminococcus intestinavium TaxID=2840684 RepID=A0A9D1MP62_9FIRM|nr:arginine repressor [Candidatus Avacidaminococcus intestinavium]